MKLLNVLSMTAALVAVCLADYDSTNDEELFDQIHNSPCKKVALGPHSFQQVITFDTEMGNHGYVYAFPPEVCPHDYVYDPALCGCVSPGLDSPRQLGLPYSGPPECVSLADIAFAAETGRYNSTTYVRYGSDKAKADLDNLTVRGVAGTSSGHALSFQGLPLLVQSFASNDLVGPWRSTLRVRPSTSGRSVLLSDDCDDGYKSLELVLTANTLGVYLRFTNDTLDSSCQAKPDSNGWYDIQLVSGATAITVTVNSSPCVSFDAGAPLARTECPVYLGASPKGPSDALIGLIDVFRFQKNPEYC